MKVMRRWRCAAPFSLSLCHNFAFSVCVCVRCCCVTFSILIEPIEIESITTMVKLIDVLVLSVSSMSLTLPRPHTNAHNLHNGNDFNYKRITFKVDFRNELSKKIWSKHFDWLVSTKTVKYDKKPFQFMSHTIRNAVKSTYTTHCSAGLDQVYFIDGF